MSVEREDETGHPGIVLRPAGETVSPHVLGRVEMVLISPEATRVPTAVAQATVVAGRGLVGDRYYSGVGTWSDYPVQTGIDLTLVEAEVLEKLGLSPAQARRNLVTRGVRLGELVGARFRVGTVECRGERPCHPCRHLESMTRPGIKAAMRGRGGLRADVVVGGQVRPGDLTELLLRT